MATGPFTKLQPISYTDVINQTPAFQLWLERVQLILSGVPGIEWEIVSKEGSKLSDIEERPHSQLQSVLQADEDATDTDAEKHLTNLLAYEWERNKVRTRSVSGDTTAVIGEHLSVDCSGGDVTVTLPAAADNTGYPIWLHKSDSSGYRILTSVKNINYQNSTMHLVSNGTDWVIS